MANANLFQPDKVHGTQQMMTSFIARAVSAAIDALNEKPGHPIVSAHARRVSVQRPPPASPMRGGQVIAQAVTRLMRGGGEYSRRAIPSLP